MLVSVKKLNYDLRTRNFHVPLNMISGKGEEFFDYLAACVYDFCVKHKIKNRGLPLTFVFGFPYHQKNIKSGILIAWTKEFNCRDVVGEDVVVFLEKSLAKHEDLLVEVTAIINDCVGTTLACSWKDRNARIGVIVDMGTNLCYVEKVKNILKLKGEEPDTQMIINTEYGNFGSTGNIEFVRTEWDREVDRDTTNPGRNLCEKMISGLYLGELVRRILLAGVRKGQLLSGKLSPILAKPESFDTSFILDIARDTAGQRISRAVLKKMGYTTPTLQDCVDMEFVCMMVLRRSALLVAASVATVVKYQRYKQCSVGIEGSFSLSQPDYTDLVQEKVEELVGHDIQLQVMFIDDGGGLGAALAGHIGRSVASGTSIPRISKCSVGNKPGEKHELEVSRSLSDYQRTTRIVEEESDTETSAHGRHYEPLLKRETLDESHASRKSASGSKSNVDRRGSARATLRKSTSELSGSPSSRQNVKSEPTSSGAEQKARSTLRKSTSEISGTSGSKPNLKRESTADNMEHRASSRSGLRKIPSDISSISSGKQNIKNDRPSSSTETKTRGSTRKSASDIANSMSNKQTVKSEQAPEVSGTKQNLKNEPTSLKKSPSNTFRKKPGEAWISSKSPISSERDEALKNKRTSVVTYSKDTPNMKAKNVLEGKLETYELVKRASLVTPAVLPRKENLKARENTGNLSKSGAVTSHPSAPADAPEKDKKAVNKQTKRE